MNHRYYLPLYIILLGVLIGCSGKSELPIETVDDRIILHRITHPELIRKYGIKSLEVENCLYESHCFHTTYTFNSCGEIEDYYPPMTGTCWHYEYDENCRLISIMAKDFRYSKYVYLENDIVQEEIHHVEQDSIMELTHIFQFKEIKLPGAFDPFVLALEPKSDTINNLSFPCGIEYPGRNTMVYSYLDNALIKSIQYYDNTNTLIVEEAFHYKN